MRRLFEGKVNNRGSALLTVILVVGFLSILATTLLYVAGMNFQIKQADYQNKRTFYTGESVLEEIRARLMEDAAAASAEAYNDISMRFIALDTMEVRELEYKKAFVARLLERWDEYDKLPAAGGDWQTFLSNYQSKGDVLKLDASLSGDAKFESVEVLLLDELNGSIRIRGLQINYIDPSTHLTTRISTDLDVIAPEIDWSAVETYTTLPEGVTAADAAKKTTIDAASSVKYANWKKE